MSAASKVQCPVCGREVPPSSENRVRFHMDVRDEFYGGGGSGVCRGTGRLPLGHVHRCECGCTWDEDA